MSPGEAMNQPVKTGQDMDSVTRRISVISGIKQFPSAYLHSLDVLPPKDFVSLPGGKRIGVRRKMKAQ
jgi:hypothetical protein